jgi:hypothetical protein
MAAYANALMDVDELEILNEHLGLCRRCREDLENFLADRRENGLELSMRYSIQRAE